VRYRSASPGTGGGGCSPRAIAARSSSVSWFFVDELPGEVRRLDLRGGEQLVAVRLRLAIDRDRGEFARTRRLGPVRFELAVQREILRRGGKKPSLRIRRGLFRALSIRPESSPIGRAPWSGYSCYSPTGP
jgi:hypothetical protein